MKTLTRSALAIIIIVALLLVACGTAPAPTAARPPLKVAWALWPGWYPILIAQQQGFFSKHGVSVEPVLYDNYQAIFPDIASGKIDGAVSGLYDLLVPASQVPLKVVMITDNSDGAEGLIATADIQTPADLVNKRIGVSPSSIGEFFTVNLLRQNGLTSADVTLTNVDAESVPAQIPGQIEAGYTWEPHLSQAMANNNHILASTADTPGLVPDVVVFQAQVADQRPEDVRGFIAAWFEAVTWWQDHQTEGNALIAEATNQKADDISTVGVKIFNQADNLSAFAPGTDTTSLFYTGQQQLDYLITTGVFNKAPDLNQLLDPSFLK
jgi:NitT/TauT family transport system substrate-binding protein